MAKIIWFNVNKITRKMEDRIIKWINKALETRVDYIKQISPEDSGDYIQSHSIRNAKRQWDVISWANSNNSDDAFWVEFWFRKAPVNWSKKDWLAIYNWVWANVMQRTTANPSLRKQVAEIISRTLAEW